MDGVRVTTGVLPGSGADPARLARDTGRRRSPQLEPAASARSPTGRSPCRCCRTSAAASSTPSSILLASADRLGPGARGGAHVVLRDGRRLPVPRPVAGRGVRQLRRVARRPDVAAARWPAAGPRRRRRRADGRLRRRPALRRRRLRQGRRRAAHRPAGRPARTRSTPRSAATSTRWPGRSPPRPTSGRRWPTCRPPSRCSTGPTRSARTTSRAEAPSEVPP